MRTKFSIKERERGWRRGHLEQGYDAIDSPRLAKEQHYTCTECIPSKTSQLKTITRNGVHVEATYMGFDNKWVKNVVPR